MVHRVRVRKLYFFSFFFSCNVSRALCLCEDKNIYIFTFTLGVLIHIFVLDIFYFFFVVLWSTVWVVVIHVLDLLASPYCIRAHCACTFELVCLMCANGVCRICRTLWS